MRTNMVFHGGAGRCAQCGDELSCLPGCARCLVERGERAQQDLAKLKRSTRRFSVFGVGMLLVWLAGVFGILVLGWRFPWQ